MNRKQRDANRATAILARCALNPNTRSDQKVYTLTLPELDALAVRVVTMLNQVYATTLTIDPPHLLSAYDDDSILAALGVSGMTSRSIDALSRHVTNAAEWSPAVGRRSLSNLLHHHGWRGNPPPCWPESTRIAYCRQQGLPLNTPEETCRRLQRYGFLTSYAARNDAEQGDMETLRTALLAEGIDPGWDEVPRRETTEEDLAVFQIRKERPWHS